MDKPKPSLTIEIPDELREIIKVPEWCEYEAELPNVEDFMSYYISRNLRPSLTPVVETSREYSINDLIEYDFQMSVVPIPIGRFIKSILQDKAVDLELLNLFQQQLEQDKKALSEQLNETEEDILLYAGYIEAIIDDYWYHKIYTNEVDSAISSFSLTMNQTIDKRHFEHFIANKLPDLLLQSAQKAGLIAEPKKRNKPAPWDIIITDLSKLKITLFPTAGDKENWYKLEYQGKVKHYRKNAFESPDRIRQMLTDLFYYLNKHTPHPVKKQCLHDWGPDAKVNIHHFNSGLYALIPSLKGQKPIPISYKKQTRLTNESKIIVNFELVVVF